jgi:hypothetical protein
VPANRRLRFLIVAQLTALALYEVGGIVTSDVRELANSLHAVALVAWSFALVLTRGIEVFVVWTYRRLPIALTPTGVRLKLRTFTWHSLNVSMPRSIPTSPLAKKTSFPELVADPLFIAAAIDCYCRSPAARVATGRSDEHDRLQAALDGA